jgi:hypothetical protein
MSKKSKLRTVLALVAALLLGVFAVTGFACRKAIFRGAVKATQWEVGVVKHLVPLPVKSVGDEKPTTSDSGS